MSELYRSPYEAYPFLSDASSNYCCDFELLTDELASSTALLAAHMKEQMDTETASLLCQELYWVCEIIYHLNPTLRTRLTVTEKEGQKLKSIIDRLQSEVGSRCQRFVLPAGTGIACEAHLLRVKAKMLVRLIYRFIEQGNTVPDLLLDIANLLSGYFFFLALKLNDLTHTEEIPFISRNY